MRLKQKRHLTLAILGGIFTKLKKGTGYVMGILSQWQKLVPKEEGNLMLFITSRTKYLRIDVGITRNVTFLTPPKELRMAWPSNGI